MRLKNNETRFGLIAILLHWLMAILIIGLLALGLYMVQLPMGIQKLKLYGWHKEYGLLVLGLVVVRWSWRMMNTSPQWALSGWERVAALWVHWSFYGFMVLMPISGWLISSSVGLQPSFFGLFTLPPLIAPNEAWRELFEEIHQWLGYALIATIVLHTAAAFKHHFINKDDILRRMIS
jgi:cytochrome b561